MIELLFFIIGYIIGVLFTSTLILFLILRKTCKNKLCNDTKKL